MPVEKHMNDKMIYRPLIEDMTWSYSRIECFEDCPYRWYLKYIDGCKETPQFYSSYGSFMHKLLEQFYNGEITGEEMQVRFLIDFGREVKGERPDDGIVAKYINSGLSYLRGFKPFPYNKVAVEKKVEFELAGNRFVGFIDYLGESDGEYYIIDNKSRDLKPRGTGKKKPTANDRLIDEMLKQLYIYSAGVKEEYGKFPRSLCFNCFRSEVFIEEPFDMEKYNEAVEWATQSIERIKDENSFPPNINYFSCKYICGVRDECCYTNG